MYTGWPGGKHLQDKGEPGTLTPGSSSPIRQTIDTKQVTGLLLTSVSLKTQKVELEANCSNSLAPLHMLLVRGGCDVTFQSFNTFKENTATVYTELPYSLKTSGEHSLLLKQRK